MPLQAGIVAVAFGQLFQSASHLLIVHIHIQQRLHTIVDSLYHTLEIDRRLADALLHQCAGLSVGGLSDSRQLTAETACHRHHFLNLAETQLRKAPCVRGIHRTQMLLKESVQSLGIVLQGAEIKQIEEDIIEIL